jgi:hypothetical protein
MLGERPTENATGRRAASSGGGASAGFLPAPSQKVQAGVNLPWLRRPGAGPARLPAGSLGHWLPPRCDQPVARGAAAAPSTLRINARERGRGGSSRRVPVTPGSSAAL